MLVRLAGRSRRWLSALLVVALVVAGLIVSVASPPSAEAAVSPLLPRPDGVVTADSLPTAQINGVAWDQEVLGDTVYVGGNFSQARPAGAAPGQNQSARSNLMSYTLSTGVMTSWAPTVNGQIRTVVASPDGSRVYIGGDFTQVNGQGRSRIAAFDTATGQLVSNFSPNVGYTVHDIAVSDTTVYVGGSYAGVGAQPRQNLSAFSSSNGALLSWAPSANRPVLAVELSDDGQYLLAGGHFETINGTSARGLAKIDAVTGELQPWPVLISNAGPDAAINSLTVQGGSVFGSGYHFGPGGNQEGPWRINVETGALEWVADCHGDTYDVYPNAAAVYAASHAHYCGNTSLGFPQYNPWKFQHNMAWSVEATGTNIREVHGYANWDGHPSPSVLHWHPTMAIGSFTGMSQAGWTVEGNDTYTVVGGEFPRVNGAAQQGLARFAVNSVAPGNRGPQFHNNQLVPDLQPYAPGAVKVSWMTGWDMDDHELTYEVRRTPGGLVHSSTEGSNWWHTPGTSFVDTGLTPGQSYSYSIWVTDSTGNRVFGASRSITAPSSVSRNSYAEAVLGDEPRLYWPLNDVPGSTTITDLAGGYHGVPGSAVTFGVTNSAVSGDTAVSVNNNNNGRIYAFGSDVAPTEYSAEVWFRTSSASGRLLGFGDLQVGNSGHRDRQIYLTNNGRVHFGIRSDGTKILSSPAQYNNNQWHQAVATLSDTTARLYVNGVLVAQRHDITNPEEYIGHWRLGGDSQSGWPSPGNANFSGSIDELSIYDYALTPAQVQAHYVASGRTANLPPAPADEYGETVFEKEPDLYWRLAETSGSNAADSGWTNQPATYQGGHTKNQAGAIQGTTNPAVAFNGSNGYVASVNSFVNPQVFSTEAWFRTTSTQGGKIIGFGNQRTTLSSNYDRHTFMLNTGQVVFGVYTGAETRITSPGAYNDGQWHHVVSSLSPDGMQLYIDGVLVGSDPNTVAESYTGFWRAGGDRVWSGATSNYLNGTLDEIAVYSRALTEAEVLQHYTIGSGNVPNVPPTAAFSHIADHLEVSFDAAESADEDGTITSYVWDFGDDNDPGSGMNPVHVYEESGTYEVALTVTDDDGAEASVTQDVTVVANEAPEALFDFEVNDLQVSFDASASTDSDGTIESYEWDFDDGEFDSGVNPVHVYSTAGTYDVTLTVTDDDGASDVLTQQVTVNEPPPNIPPVADFDVEITHLMVSVDASGSTDEDGDIVAYNWDFGDGNSATGPTANHTFATADTYTITLTVTDDDGDNDSTSQQVTVVEPPANVPPTASFTALTNDLTVSVDGSGSTDSDGTIESYVWDFGDGNDATGAIASHTYATADTYTITLTVTDDDGAEDTYTETVTVTAPPVNQAPEAAFTASVSGLTVTLDASGSSDPDGTIESYTWVLGDGNTATGEVVVHTYEAADSYEVTLTVTDDGGAEDSDTQSVTVEEPPAENEPPTASFTTSVNGLTVSLDGTASSDPDGSLTSYAWTFGDGNSGTGATTSHTYGASGTYQVTLTVVDDDGADDSVTQEVVIAGSPTPVTYATDTFSRTANNGWGVAELGGNWSTTNTASLFSVSSGVGRITAPNAGSGPTIWLNSVSAQDIEATVDVAMDKPATGGGAYNYLIVRRSGNNDYRLVARSMPTGTQLLLIATVNGSDQFLANTTIPLVTGPDDVLRLRLVAEGTSPTVLSGKVWLVGDSEPSTWQVTATNSTPALQGAGGIGLRTYLSGSTTNAPVVSSFDNLHVGGIGQVPVNQAPVAAFTSVVDGLSVTVDGTGSSDADGTIASYAWDFGDGNSATGATAGHTYDVSDTYQVTLTVTDDEGASHAVTHQVEVVDDEPPAENVPPVAAFTFEVDELTVSFDSSGSSDADGEIVVFEWDFGDGDGSDVAAPTHTYDVSDTYQVTLTVTDDEGASHAVTHEVVVAGDEPPAENVPPVAAFTFEVDELTVSFDSSGSSDADGEIVVFEWDFGDGDGSDVAAPTHTYDASGGYEVTLTVTDNDGASAVFTDVVAVEDAPVQGPEIFVEDGFDRDLATGWGEASVGGSWVLSGSSTNFWVEDGQGAIRMLNPGSGPRVSLPGASVLDSDMTVQVELDRAPAGGDTYVILSSRQAGSNSYNLKARYMPNQTMLIVTQVLNGSETILASTTIPGPYQVGQVYNVRFQVEGAGTTTLRGRAWLVGADEPSNWQVTTTSTAAALQVAGGVGIQAYLGGNATNAPVVARFDNLLVASIPE